VKLVIVLHPYRNHLSQVQMASLIVVQQFELFQIDFRNSKGFESLQQRHAPTIEIAESV